MPDHVCVAGQVSAVALLSAHQGGWDEVLLVLVPIALFAGLLAVANRRAAREQAEREPGELPDPE